MLALTKTDDFPGWEHFAPKALEYTTTGKVQTGDAIKLIQKVGGKKVGFLGLAFRTGTDDLRESPILEVMKTLVEEGVEVIAYDPTIRTDTLLHNQSDRVRYACPQRESAKQFLSNALCKSAAKVVEGCETLVVTHHTRELQELIASRRECKVIDLVDLFSEQ